MERMNRRAVIKGVSTTLAAMALPVMANASALPMLLHAKTSMARFPDAVEEIESFGFKVTLSLCGDQPADFFISFPNGCHIWPDQHECFHRFSDCIRNHTADAVDYLVSTGRVQRFSAKSLPV